MEADVTTRSHAAAKIFSSPSFCQNSTSKSRPASCLRTRRLITRRSAICSIIPLFAGHAVNRGANPVPGLLRGSLAGDVFQAALAYFLLAHDELLDLFRHGNSAMAEEADVLGDLDVSDFPLAACLDIFRRGRFAGFELH